MLTKNAARRIFKVSKNKAMRILVKAGGCSGFQYQYLFDDQIEQEGDKVFVNFHHGKKIKLFIDESSFDLIKGSKVDFVENFEQSYFAIVNPLATSGCGCGKSFSV